MDRASANRIDIDHEMKQAYLDYAMSVIIARALPDARDGLKPVQRRILYSMYDMGMRLNSDYKKSARIVGEVLGKYHPHGDSAVYEAMARMAQDFTMRSLLIDGQGNFGSVDGDPPAAMRYTEARLAPPALDLLLDINKDTVDYVANFDGTLQEPVVLPASIPNLLVNGTTGIAVGMATSIPPHNLGEVVDALVYMLQRWEKMDNISVSQLMQFIQGPDFPTGGIILEEKSQDNILAAYGSGRGRISIQARVHSEEMERGKSRLIITELPYMVNKSALIERVAELAREGHTEGISDLRDESDRNGMRIVIELTKNMDPNAVLTDLFRRTPLQTTFSIIMLALVDGEPRTLTLKQALRVYLEHRLEVIKRRSEFDLTRARQRAHILEGLLVALNNLDPIIQLIRKSADVDVAKTKLMKHFKLSSLQADAILEMQLRRLAALERRKIDSEHKELLLTIKDLEHLLKSPKLMRGVAVDDLVKIKETYAEKRRTQIALFKPGKMKQFTMESAHKINEKPCWIGISREGLISRTSDEKLPRMSGNEAPRLLARALSTDTLYLVSSNGSTAAIAVHTLPETGKLSEGLPYFKATSLKESDQPAALFVLPSNRKLIRDETFILTITQAGLVKKSLVQSLPGPSAQSFILSKVNEGDSLGWAFLTDGQREVLLASSFGYSIRFKEDEVRPMGLLAAGVNGIKLAEGDQVIGAETLPGKGEVFLLSNDGKAKRVLVSDFPKQGRFGKGVIAWEMPAGSHLVGMTLGKGNLVISGHLHKAAAKSLRLDEAPIRKRSATKGDAVIEVKPGDEVTDLVIPWVFDPDLLLTANGTSTSTFNRKSGKGSKKT